MLILNAVERGLVLAQLNMPAIVNFPWDPLPDGRSGWGRCTEEGVGEGELWMKCEMKIKKRKEKNVTHLKNILRIF